MQQGGKSWYDKKQIQNKNYFWRNVVLQREIIEVLVEGLVFRGHLVSVEDVSSKSMTEDVKQNIQNDLNSIEEVCQKWERYCRTIYLKIQLLSYYFKVKTETGELTWQLSLWCIINQDLTMNLFTKIFIINTYKRKAFIHLIN